MAITTFADIYSGVVQQFPFAKTATTGSSADNPTMTFGWNGRPDNGSVGLNISGDLRTNTSAGAVPFKNPAAGQNTYLSAFSSQGAGVPNGKSLLLIDLLWITAAVSAVTTTQTINSITLPARDIDGSTNGRGVYIAMWHTVQYSGSNAYTATITYTNSANNGSRIGTVSRSGGASNRWVPFGLAEGDEGVRSVQDFTFSALPGTSGFTVLIAYRPIVMISSQFTNGDDWISEKAFTLALPRIYDDSCVTSINFAAQSNTTAGVFTLAQG